MGPTYSHKDPYKRETGGWESEGDVTTEAEVRTGRTRSQEMQEKARKGYFPRVSRRNAALLNQFGFPVSGNVRE